MALGGDSGAGWSQAREPEEVDVPTATEHGIPVTPGQVVVGLDFDGVLNITPDGGPLHEGFEQHIVELDRRNWPHHPYIRPLPAGPGPFLHRIIVNPAHGQMVRSWLAAGAQVFWATTWERAVLRNAPLCDIPELPVLEISKVLTDDLPTRTADWKVAGLQAAFPGHPLVWVDDFGDQVRAESTFGEPPAPMLVVAPRDTVGLTSEQSDQVLSFIHRWRPDGPGAPD
jgi:hypothetical protein